MNVLWFLKILQDPKDEKEKKSKKSSAASSASKAAANKALAENVELVLSNINQAYQKQMSQPATTPTQGESVLILHTVKPHLYGPHLSALFIWPHVWEPIWFYI